MNLIKHDSNIEVALYTTEIVDGIGVECSYPGYERVFIPRAAAYWDIKGDAEMVQEVTNVERITFPTCLSGDAEIIRSFGLIIQGEMVLSGKLMSFFAISQGITPEFAIGDLNWKL